MQEGVNFLNDEEDKKKISQDKSDRKSVVDFELVNLKPKKDNKKIEKTEKKDLAKETKIKTPELKPDTQNQAPKNSWFSKFFQAKNKDPKPAVVADKKTPPQDEKKNDLPKEDKPQIESAEMDSNDFSDFDINLIPEEKHKFTFVQKIVLIVIIFVFVIGVFGVVKFFLHQSNQKEGIKLESLNQEIKQVDVDIKDITKDTEEALVWYKKVELSEDLISKHQWWSRFFDVLERDTPVYVYYKNLSVSPGNKIVLEAVAKNNQDLARAIVVYRNLDYLEDVNITAINQLDDDRGEIGEKNTEFSLSFTVKKEFLETN